MSKHAQETKTPGEYEEGPDEMAYGEKALDGASFDGSSDDSAAHGAAPGVSKVEAFNRVLYKSGRSGKLLLWALAVSIMITMFVYALDQGITTTVFSAMATSTFGLHENLAAVSTASQIIRAISKPFIGKMADITSRPTTYCVVVFFYVIGFVVAASSSTFAAYVIGISSTAVGKSGLDLLSDILVGDLTPLEWRGFFGSLLSTPFIVTVPINGFIASGFAPDHWRWGLGMFAIMVPVLISPAIATLYVMQWRGKKMGMVSMAGSKMQRSGDDDAAPKTVRSWLGLLSRGLIEIDMVGLVLLGFAFALILLPFTLAKAASGGWSNPSMIAMIAVGFVILVGFVLFECFVAPKPLMTRRILRNRAFLAAVVIDVFNQMASSVRNTYFSSYVWVIKPWTTYQWTIFLGITTMGLSLLGPFVGLLQRSTHRYKNLMMFGAVGKLVAYGLFVDAGSNTMTQSTARLTVAQLLFCLGSFSVVGARVGSQASVPHEDMATVISLLSLWSTLGSSVGSAISSAIWTNMMLERMQRELPTVPLATLEKLYGSIIKVRAGYAFDSPIRQGVIRAYAQTNGIIAITALCLAAVPVVATLFMPNYYLGKQQNAVTSKGLDGEHVEVPRLEEHAGERKWYHRLRDAYRRDV